MTIHPRLQSAPERSRPSHLHARINPDQIIGINRIAGFHDSRRRTPDPANKAILDLRHFSPATRPHDRSLPFRRSIAKPEAAECKELLAKGKLWFAVAPPALGSVASPCRKIRAAHPNPAVWGLYESLQLATSVFYECSRLV
jgi:hypothetical protein